jgi:hypothetical protein
MSWHTPCHYQECVQTACHSFGKAFTTNALKWLRLSQAKNSPYVLLTEPAVTDPVWVVCDMHPSGCVAYYSQGEDWKTMKPASFMSKKFTDMQCSYFTYEHETLGAIEALKKWDDNLLGLTEIWIITDHEALKTFMLKAHSRPCQICWLQWFSWYWLKFIHILGSQNGSADALSWLFENLNSKAQLEDLSTSELYGLSFQNACLHFEIWDFLYPQGILNPQILHCLSLCFRWQAWQNWAKPLKPQVLIGFIGFTSCNKGGLVSNLATRGWFALVNDANWPLVTGFLTGSPWLQEVKPTKTFQTLGFRGLAGFCWLWTVSTQPWEFADVSLSRVFRGNQHPQGYQSVFWLNTN